MHRLAFVDLVVPALLAALSTTSQNDSTVFLHMYSMAILGYKRPLEDKDLWSLNEDDTSKIIVQQLSGEWDKEKAKCKQ